MSRPSAQFEEADYIVVGAGSAGCAVAARLSETADTSVTLIEAGGWPRSLWVSVPLGVGKLLQNPRYTWPFYTEPEPALEDKAIYWPRGKVVGGSSAINGMVYVRGDPAEYDAWAKAGNAGWGYGDVAACFKRLESFPEGDPVTRGQSGPMHIASRRSWDPDPLSDAFLASCVEAGIPAVSDYNDGSFEGASYLQQTSWRGRRWTAADGYLRPARRRPNLRVRTGAHVTRILFDGTRAIGVEYLEGSELRQVHCRGEVLLCAGALQSPQILELSGIGDADRLREHDIPVVQHLPGVGENLQDHLQVRLTYECTRPLTINDILCSRLHGLRHGLLYLARRRGLLSTTSSTAHAIARTVPELNRPDVKIQIALISGQDRYSRSKQLGIDRFPGFSLGVFMLRPMSRGSVHIASADPRKPPAMRANYLAHQEERRTYLAALRKIREIAAQPAFRDLLRRETRPGPDVADEAGLMAYIARTGQTSWHPISSCRMGTDADAVTDPSLKVRGTEGLRVIDASIMPSMASSNTNGPAIMIGEKGVEIIRSQA